MAEPWYCRAVHCQWKVDIKAGGFFSKEVSVTKHQISFFPTPFNDDFLMMKILFSSTKQRLSSRKEIALMFATLETLFIPDHCVSSFSLETGCWKLLLCFCFFLLWSCCGVTHSHSDKHRMVGSEASLSAHAVILDGWHCAMLLFQVAVCLVLGQTLLIKTLVVYFSSQEWCFHSGLYNCVSASPL